MVSHRCLILLMFAIIAISLLQPVHSQRVRTLGGKTKRSKKSKTTETSKKGSKIKKISKKSKKDKKGSKMKKSKKSSTSGNGTIVEGSTFEKEYRLEKLTSQFLSNIDDIAREGYEEKSETDLYYRDHVEKFFVDDKENIEWMIDAGDRSSTLIGNAAISDLFFSFAQREFSFHTFSNFVVDPSMQSVKLQYSATVKEMDENIQDLFGNINVEYDEDQKINSVETKRLYSIDRGS